jgi:hypothetical protein
MRGIICVAASLMLLAVSNAFPADLENRKRWVDEEDAVIFMARLKETNIPFHRDSDGWIWYPAAEERLVGQIELAVASRCGIGVNYLDPRDAALFVAELERENISYTSCRHFGKEYLVWDPRFDKRAKELMEKVDDLSLKRHEEELNRSSRAK